MKGGAYGQLKTNISKSNIMKKMDLNYYQCLMVVLNLIWIKQMKLVKL